MIKKKRGWLRNFPPYLSSAPKTPSRLIKCEKKRRLLTKDISSHYPIKLSELQPTDADVVSDQLYVELVHDYDSVTGDFFQLDVFTYDIVDQENPDYERELKEYAVCMEAWRQEKARHDIELAKWKAWKKHEDEKDLKNRLDKAEKLLKEHGRLK